MAITQKCLLKDLRKDELLSKLNEYSVYTPSSASKIALYETLKEYMIEKVMNPETHWFEVQRSPRSPKKSTGKSQAPEDGDTGTSPAPEHCDRERQITGMPLEKVIEELHLFDPPSLPAESDIAGILVEPTTPSQVKKILLANDLTPPVLKEALQKFANMIICRHPPVVTPMKRLKGNNWKELLLMKCLEERVAVYSLNNNINEWLISCFDVQEKKPLEIQSGIGGSCMNEPQYVMCWRATLREKITPKDALGKVKEHLCSDAVSLAKAPGSRSVSSVAVCAGSGGSLLKDVSASLFVTGEMSRQEILDAKYSGTSVIMVEHSKIEEVYLDYLKEELKSKFGANISIIIEDRQTLFDM